MKKNDIHIPIHILYLFILDIFTKKKMESSCLNKKEKILMFKVMLVLVVLFFFVLHYMKIF